MKRHRLESGTSLIQLAIILSLILITCVIGVVNLSQIAKSNSKADDPGRYLYTSNQAVAGIEGTRVILYSPVETNKRLKIVLDDYKTSTGDSKICSFLAHNSGDQFYIAHGTVVCLDESGSAIEVIADAEIPEKVIQALQQYYQDLGSKELLTQIAFNFKERNVPLEARNFAIRNAELENFQSEESLDYSSGSEPGFDDSDPGAGYTLPEVPKYEEDENPIEDVPNHINPVPGNNPGRGEGRNPGKDDADNSFNEIDEALPEFPEHERPEWHHPNNNSDHGEGLEDYNGNEDLDEPELGLNPATPPILPRNPEESEIHDSEREKKEDSEAIEHEVPIVPNPNPDIPLSIVPPGLGKNPEDLPPAFQEEDESDLIDVPIYDGNPRPPNPEKLPR
ncbi:MAG: hypothetical protein KDD56_05415 [Bdellovibrionales bacterium]|nr:hypothetical protein [Bdellovibrionales bacterium]